MQSITTSSHCEYNEDMKTISVCMIVKNEQETLARILECAKKFADEIILVDTGSTDLTKNIAKTPKNITKDSQMLVVSIITKRVIVLVKDESKLGMLCETNCLSASVSLVYVLIISPVLFVSKYEIGSDCILLKRFVLVWCKNLWVKIAFNLV